ncbi:MAG: serine--tRNA ligase, partial [Solirubrobacterales bacterium]|nr:serine--tRNA ligase [Solirubrobacterales bacterium]
MGTSEVPLASFHADEILTGDKLPLRYAGFSTCFRREAGAAGKDTRGILRVHQFDKVEMFSFVPAEESLNEHE